MDYNEVLRRARERIGPKCKVCPECNGLGCGNTMPGPGSKAPGNGANDNWRAWRRWSLNMDTIAPNTPVDTSLALLGRTFSLPVIAAPIGSLRAQFNPEDDIRDYNACCIAAAAQTGIAASFGDGLDARVFPHGCALTQQYGGIGLPVINPLSMDTIKANLDLANAAQPFAVSVVIDSAGLPHLKAASPDAGSKTVAELRELCDYAQMPMILKGIMTVRGAEKAVEAGAAAIVVSNHGGRVLPGAAATADVLPEIADAVGGRVKILVDGGIRSGTDIFRALALGADAVMICRPFLISYYGGGTEGIVTYVEKLRAERYATWEWNYGKSPVCTMLRRRRVDGCGLIEAYITVEHGLVSAVTFKGDFFSAEEPEALAARFVGHTPDRAGYTAALDGVETARYFAGLQADELIDILCEG